MEELNGCTVITPADTAEMLNWGAESTAGAYTALIGAIPVGAPPPPLHLHPNTDEAFYIAEGQAAFRLGDEEISAVAGSLVFVPKGTIHTAWNNGDVPTRGVIIISPGNAEHEFVVVEDGPAEPPG
jgi:mannose-6-phosphate isomerase-like protein (cupin superfamily)